MPVPIESAIVILRGKRVILDSDLASLYGVTTKRLNEQVRRNRHRFPEDFMFRLSIQEVEGLRSQIATSNPTRGGRRYLPHAFTEHGAIMAANVLNSRLAMDASIMLVRIFVQLRGVAAEHLDIKRRLQDLEQRLSKSFSRHEEELREVRFLISQLEAKLEEPPKENKRRIGFYSEREEGYNDCLMRPATMLKSLPQLDRSAI